MKNNRITILGYGRSGIAAAKLAKHVGFDVFISDSRKLIPELLETEYKYELGGHSQKIYDSNIIVVSPGISKKTEIKKLKELYYNPQSIPKVVKTQVAVQIEEKKNELRNIYSTPKDMFTLQSFGKWSVVQVVKLILGMPVIPGR